MESWRQADLAFQDQPPVILTEQEHEELIAALAMLLLSNASVIADE